MSEVYTRRQWLTLQAIFGGASIFEAIEAVSSVALEHPEWDMGERRSANEWEDEAG